MCLYLGCSGDGWGVGRGLDQGQEVWGGVISV